MYLIAFTKDGFFFDIKALSLSNISTAIAELEDPSVIKQNPALSYFNIGIPSLYLGNVEISYSLRDVKKFIILHLKDT
jgi:hypothetical protein